MKKHRTPSSRSKDEALNKRLSAYSTAGKAALAAGAAVGVSTVAEAQVMNLTASSFTATPTLTLGSTIGATTSDTASDSKGFMVGPIGLGVDFFVVQTNSSYTITTTPSTTTTYLYADGSASIQFNGGSGGGIAASSDDLKNLSPGASVKGFAFNTGYYQLFATSASTSSTSSWILGNKIGGNFNLGSAGYVGFKVEKSASNYYYGWLRVQVTGDANGRAQTIEFVADGSGVYGAYNSTLNGAILAGQTAAAVPEPANVAIGLSLFAMGAVGVREYRRRRKEVASK